MAFDISDWAYDSATQDCGGCSGGWYKFYIAERSDIDLGNVTVDADGKISALPLLPAGNLVRVVPLQDDNTGGEGNMTREDQFSPALWEFSLTFSVSATGNNVARAEEILASLCDPVIIACDNCCNVYVFNLVPVTCNGATELRPYVVPMRLTEVSRAFGTPTTRQTRVWTLAGTSNTAETYATLSCADVDELATLG